MSNINRIRSQIQRHFDNKKKEWIERKKNANRLKWGKYYNDQRWKDLREYQFANHPICYICECEGVITPCECVHHLRPFSTGRTEEEKWQLFLNPNNLISLCQEHHDMIHRIMKEKNLDYVTPKQVIDYEENLKQFL